VYIWFDKLVGMNFGKLSFRRKRDKAASQPAE
jgi:hypothetical protein